MAGSENSIGERSVSAEAEVKSALMKASVTADQPDQQGEHSIPMNHQGEIAAEGELEIVIDEELKALIPPLSEEEMAGLEVDILRDGVREPFSVWHHDNKLILLDGHHRHEICQRWDLPFPEPFRVNLNTREEAILWMIKNQFHRRNLKLFQRIELGACRETSQVSDASGTQLCGVAPCATFHDMWLRGPENLAPRAPVSPKSSALGSF